MSVSLTQKPQGAGAAILVEKRGGGLSRSIDEAIRRSGAFLLRQQASAGYWCGELEADTTLESDTIKLWHLLGRVDSTRQERLVRTLLRQQRPDGGWPIYKGGPAELNATVKAYVALRLAGRQTGEPILRKAAETIRRLGGLERINSFEKVYLALFGLYPWDQVPALPPEVVLLPDWFPINIYEVSYWSRTILVPLAVVYALRPSWTRAPFDVEELWIHPSRKKARITNSQRGGTGWRIFFLLVDRLLKLHEDSPWKPLRARALRAADQWMTRHLMETDGLGAIYPAMLNAVFALKALGYADGDPLLEEAIRQVQRLELEDEQGLKLQPCFSPVWDTALTAYTLGKLRRQEQVPGTAPVADAGDERYLVPGLSAALARALEWLRQSEVRIWGDWRVKNRGARPGGWAFQFRNPFYPDVDDTAQALLAMLTVWGPEKARSLGAFQRGLAWILSMQNRDGGWSSFDKDNNCRALTHFPFADHNAMLDPSACDITGRVLELLRVAGMPREHPAVRRAAAFLRGHQESDGTWFGRWGVSYIYGTWLALRGLAAAGEPTEGIRCQQAGRWLVSRQNPDGGWGESCRSYDDAAAKGQGPSTPSQTAWALMALMSLGWVGEPAFRKGLDTLLSGQQENGDWPEEESFTGTGFPRVFYLQYHLYRSYFPLLALVEAREQIHQRHPREGGDQNLSPTRSGIPASAGMTTRG